MRHPHVVVRSAARIDEIPGNAAFGVAREIEVEIHGHAELQIAEIDAGFAPTPHGHHEDHAARPLAAARGSTGAAEAGTETAGGEVRPAAPPDSRQAARVLGRHSGLGFLPLGRLPHAVRHTQQVVAPLVETRGPAVHIVPIVEPVDDPFVHNGHRERRS